MQGGGDAQRSDGADVDLLHLLVKVHVVQRLVLLPKVARVVDDVIERLGHLRDHLTVDGAVVRHVDASDHLAAESVKLGRGAATDDDRLGALSNELLGDGEAEALIAARDEHALPLEEGAVVHRLNVQESSILLLLCAVEASDLISQRVDALIGGSHASD